MPPTPPVTRVDSTDGVELAVHDLGGDGPPLLLCHATGFHGLVWTPLVAALGGRFHAWAVDFRGHGDSAPPAHGRMEWRGFGEDVLAVVDHLGLDRPFGIGHSKGGAALFLGEANRPGTFRSLWTFEPIVMPVEDVASVPPNGDPPRSDGARRRRQVFESHDAAYDNFASKPPLDELSPEALRAYVEHGFASQPDGTVRIKCHPDTEAATYEMAPASGAFTRLAEVRCPVTLAGGTGRNTPMTPDVLELVAGRLPSARVEIFDGLGHFGPLQDPPRIAAAVLGAFAGS